MLFAQALACALLVLAAQSVSAERRLLVRDIPHQAQQCRNTVQGLNMVADDRGVVCKRSELSYSTGCCVGGQQHDCSLCNTNDSCCSEFEACVSCCLAPQHNAVTLAKENLRSPRHKDSGFWGDAFEYCKGVCRTHSRSTAHENSYISARHHCFSKLGRPMLSDPLPANVLTGVEVVAGDKNSTCSTVCAARQPAGRCSQEHLRWLNSCDRLREHFGCEAGCDEVMGLGPSYVDGGAPKASRPAMCFAQPSQRATLSCDAGEQHHQMLCPCVRVEGRARR